MGVLFDSEIPQGYNADHSPIFLYNRQAADRFLLHEPGCIFVSILWQQSCDVLTADRAKVSVFGTALGESPDHDIAVGDNSTKGAALFDYNRADVLVSHDGR